MGRWLLGLLWAILEGGGPLLLEEPELFLHPEVVSFSRRCLPHAAAVRPADDCGPHSVELLRDGGIGLGEILL